MNQQNYEGNFSSQTDVIGNFEEKGLSEPDFIWAIYSEESYEGSALVVYFDSNVNAWFSVHGSHCSCYGLEGQWLPDMFDPVVYFKSLENMRSTLSTWAMSAKELEEFNEWLKWAAHHTINAVIA